MDKAPDFGPEMLWRLQVRILSWSIFFAQQYLFLGSFSTQLYGSLILNCHVFARGVSSVFGFLALLRGEVSSGNGGSASLGRQYLHGVGVDGRLIVEKM